MIKLMLYDILFKYLKSFFFLIILAKQNYIIEKIFTLN